MSNISEELYKFSNRIKLNKIALELEDIKNKTKAQQEKIFKVSQKIVFKSENITKELKNAAKELKQTKEKISQ